MQIYANLEKAVTSNLDLEWGDKSQPLFLLMKKKMLNTERNMQLH